MRLNYLFLLLLIASVSFLFSCKKSGPSKIDKLVIGVSGGDDPAEMMSCFKSLAPYFEKEMGVKKVEIYITSDYASVIEAMRSKKVDIAHLGELSYLLAVDRAGAEAIAMTGTVDGLRFTSSVILTGINSGLKNIDDVKKRSKKLTLSFGDPACTSGHLYPRNYLNSINLEPEKSFKSVFFANNYASAILNAVSGKVDLACTFSLALNRLIDKKMIKKEDYRIIWESKPYIGTPVSVRNDLPSGLKEKIKLAYLNLATKEPIIWENFKNKIYTFYPPEMRKKLIYISANDSLYNEIREVARNCKGFNFLNSK